MNSQPIVMFLGLIGIYIFIVINLYSPLGIIYFTIAYFIFLTLLKVYLDGGFFLSLYHLTFIAYFYYIGKEIWFYNPMLMEFKVEEVVQALQIISIGAAIISTALACHSSRYLYVNRNISTSQPWILKKWLTLVLLCIYTGTMAYPAFLTITMGRGAVWENSFASLNIIIPFINAIGYLLPIFIHLSFQKSKGFNVIKYGLILFVFLIQIGIGNRFVILFSFFIYISMVIDVRKIGMKNVLLPIIILSSISLLMSQLRAGDVSGPNIENSGQLSEGIVYYFSGLVRFYEQNNHTYLPIYTTFSLYFLMPRAIWASKPELIGSWLLDTGVFMTRFSDGHSGSVSFVGPFFADFGLLFFVPLIGLAFILVRLDKYLLKYIGDHSYKGIIAASFVPLVFFGYRSFNTSVAAEFILIMIVYLAAKFNHLQMKY